MNLLKYLALYLSFSILLITACSTQSTSPQTDPYASLSVNNIAILPIVTVAEKSETFTYSQLKNQERGVEVLTEIIGDYFSEHKNITILNDERVDSFNVAYTANRITQARSIAKNLKADAAMIINMNRFTDREGGKYSVQSPASVSFDYQLMHTETGQTLCSGVFDETQKSLTDNILSFKTVFKRKLQWITAEELARDGVQSKFDSCRYLALPQSNDAAAK